MATAMGFACYPCVRCERIALMGSRDEAFQEMVDRITEGELREIVAAACDDD
jgi:hypothetical protein